MTGLDPPVIPGQREALDPESRKIGNPDVTGFRVRSLRERPGMTENYLNSLRTVLTVSAIT